jgi:hypothetical protein
VPPFLRGNGTHSRIVVHGHPRRHLGHKLFDLSFAQVGKLRWEEGRKVGSDGQGTIVLHELDSGAHIAAWKKGGGRIVVCRHACTP